MNRWALKFVYLLFPLIMLFALSSCRTNYVRGAIDNEADKQGNAFWDRSFTKCGDSYYGKLPSKLFEIKEPVFYTNHQMEGRVLSEADKLNGIEWEGGTMLVFCKVHRFYFDGNWSDWIDHRPREVDSKLDLPLRKIRGQWEFDVQNNEKFEGVPCDQIPN